MTEAEEFRAMYSVVFNYTIPIKENATSPDDRMGAGVLIDVAGCLLVATAAHCINSDPAVLEDSFVLAGEKGRIRILRRGIHPTLDIGFMELDLNKDIPSLSKGAATLAMLGFGPLTSADVVHIVGFPEVARKLANNHLTVERKGFGTQLIRHDLEHLYFSYPTKGFTWDYQRNEWTQAPFDENPKGYSGGGVWAFTQPKEGELFSPQRHIQLYGIQSAWDESKRYVKCVSIAYWLLGIGSICPDLQGAITEQFPSVNFLKV